jgi:hypothetical protein
MQFNKLLTLGIPGWSQEPETKEAQDSFPSKYSYLLNLG